MDYLYYVTWAVVGLIAGFLASQIVNHTGEGLLWDIILGCIGSLVGNWVAGFFNFTDTTRYGLNLRSILVATLGAVLVLVVWHTLLRAIFVKPKSQ